jgi:sec-independent protein translocase protein TatC
MAAHPNILVLPILALPLVLALMARFSLITGDAMIRARRYAIFGFFAVAAVFTPPDALSQVIFALALIGLYEISIWCVRAAS